MQQFATDSAIQSRKPLHQMTALVVDVVDNMRSIISAMLSDMGFNRVVTASNGAQAVQLLSVTAVDLIIAESQLPKLNGLGLLQHVRQHDMMAGIPFIMLASVLEQTAVMQAIELKVSDYVAKPFSGRILRSRIMRAMGQPQAVPAKTGSQQEAVAAKNDQQRILVVDDVPDNIQVISDILRQDYVVKAATSGETALKICAAEPQPDLVLLDIMMPGMDGFEVCRRLKANPDTQHITIIFLTAVNDAENTVKGFTLGAVDYITKPVNPPILQARVKTHCRMVQDQKMLREQLDSMVQNSRLKPEALQQAGQNINQSLAVLFDALAELKKTPVADLPQLQQAQQAAEQLSSLLVGQKLN